MGEAKAKPLQCQAAEAGSRTQAEMEVAEFLGLEVMKSAKGRDKIAAFAQNFAKWHSLSQDIGSPHNAKWRATELNISDGRKIFKWAKFFPEFMKSRRALLRAGTEQSYDRYRSLCESLGRAVSCIYFFYENVQWACAMGLLRADKLPGHLARVQLMGGSANLKTNKYYCSMYKLYVALLGEAVW